VDRLPQQAALDQGRSVLEQARMSPSQLLKRGVPVNQDGVIRSAFDLLRYGLTTRAQLESIWPDVAGIASQEFEKLEIET
jgi:tRNA uridine 5-carboxymethylaminomethyl modification enzyme